MSSNFIQSGNQSYLKNALGSIDDTELDDMVLAAVNGGDVYYLGFDTTPGPTGGPGLYDSKTGNEINPTGAALDFLKSTVYGIRPVANNGSGSNPLGILGRS